VLESLRIQNEKSTSNTAAAARAAPIRAMSAILPALHKIVAGEDLTHHEAEAAMEEILAGRATDAQIGGLLAALRAKGVTVEELVGFATIMRRHAQPVFPPGRPRSFKGGGALVDTCGTGGGAAGTFNISTAAAFVVAGAGACVAKHGNRSLNVGSADVMEALGVSLDVPIERVGEAIENIGIGFFFAPAVHTAMRHAMRARNDLRMRTVFNLLGPLTNPAGAQAQVLGVYEAGLVEVVAHALAELGTERAFVVYGCDGLDEISLSGETRVGEVRDKAVRSYTVVPEDFGLRRAPIGELAGGDAAANAGTIRRILGGESGPRRDIVLANASAALVAAGRATDFLDGVRRAAQAIDSGAAQAKLDALIAFSREHEQKTGAVTNA
jgi:anthranilate phosphoribosyltransferase